MLAVSDAFKNAILPPHTQAIREVSYKRRRWSQADLDFEWEDDWTIVSRDELAGVSPVVGQLDSDQLNEFKVSNLTITFKNADNKWREDNPFGVFAPDAASPIYPYDPYWMKFRVRVGVTLADGTIEYASLFSGLAVEYTHASQDQVQVTVEGLESLLINANAEDVSTLVTEEFSAGPGTEFTTVNPGVGIVDEVSVNGLKKTAGSDYDVSQLDEPSLGAKVTFTGSTSNVRITYRYWRQNQRIEELVTALLTAAGVSGASQAVDPVIFSNPILNAVVVDSQTDWQAGTPSAVDLTSIPGSATIDILDAQNYHTLDDFSSDPAVNWTFGGNLSWSWQGNARLRYDKAGVTHKGVARHATTAAQIGRWKWVMNGVDLAGFDKVVIGFQASGDVNDAFSPFYPYSFTGNYLRVLAPPYSGDANIRWELYIQNILVAATSYNVGLVDLQMQVDRLSDGTTRVYVDGVLILQAQSLNRGGISFFGFGSEQGSFIITDREFDNVVVPNGTFIGTWSSPTYDLSSGLISIGRLTSVQDVGGGIIGFQTRTSADGVTWDSWEDVAANGQVQSVNRRYIQCRINFIGDPARYEQPIVSSIRIEYQTAVATITLAKFTGQTVYDAIKSLGRFCNYEWGFNSEEVFFFRAKSVQKQANEILERSDVKGISSLTSGYDRVYSRVSVTYGAFTAELRAPGQHPRDPKSRFKDRAYDVSVTDIIIGNDADVAHGVARLYFSQLTQPKRRMKAPCRFLPHVELSDVLLLSFDQNRQRKTWTLGDETVALGDKDVNLWGPREQIVSGMYVKVIGARQDIWNYATEFDLEEIL